jgi:hypothetical protein
VIGLGAQRAPLRFGAVLLLALLDGCVEQVELGWSQSAIADPPLGFVVAVGGCNCFYSDGICWLVDDSGVVQSTVGSFDPNFSEAQCLEQCLHWAARPPTGCSLAGAGTAFAGAGDSPGSVASAAQYTFGD